MTRRRLLGALAAALVLPLAGCGRKSMPEQPDDSVFPLKYPYTPMPVSPAAKARARDERAADPEFQPPQPRLETLPRPAAVPESKP
jgi:predicted small lipoprotein YifL